MNIMQPIYKWISGFGFKNDYTDLGVVLMIGKGGNLMLYLPTQNTPTDTHVPTHQ